MVRRHRQFVCALSLLFILGLSLFAQTPAPRQIYIPFPDAQPILKQLDEIVPAEFKGKSADQQSAIWANWVAGRDRKIRARLMQGDEDSLVNFLLFGTSYTKQARLTPEQVSRIANNKTAAPDAQQIRLVRVLRARTDDLVSGAAAPGNNQRLLFARRIFSEIKGYNLRTSEGRDQARDYLQASLERVLSESADYSRILEQARLLGSATEEFAARSRLYSNRGLSSDTSLLPNFAIEESLRTMAIRKLWSPASIRRVAIIGPGLDFTDKQEGYDFYPQQSIQPFAIVDSLLRLGLAQPRDLQVITFDLSPRVNDHLARAQARAQANAQHGPGYTLQLPRDLHADWKAEAINYWSHFGDRVGISVPPVQVPVTAGDLQTRAVRIRPEIVSRLTPVDLNIVLQRAVLPATERFDLVIATNILVYYDVFEQTLAMANVASMLRPGGFLLSNNALVEFPFVDLHSVGYLTVVYSSRPNDGDHIVWYRHD